MFLKALSIIFSVIVPLSFASARVPDLQLTCYASHSENGQFGKTLFDDDVEFKSGFSEIKSIFKNAEDIDGIVSRGPDNKICIGFMKGNQELALSCAFVGKMKTYEDLRLKYSLQNESFYFSCGLK